MFRNFGTYGYIVDNSLFSYRLLDDFPALEEKYISQSGTQMLDMLNRKPQRVEDIVERLMHIFEGVNYKVLERDTIEFFLQLAKEGYVDCGNTESSCGAGNFDVDLKNNSDYVLKKGGIEEKNFRKKQYFLKNIHIEIADKCNENCLHCYIPPIYKNKFMRDNVFYKIIDEGRDMNILNVTLSGGEPLLHPQFIEFLRKCNEKDLSVNVLSNLTLLDDNILVEMKKNKLLSVQTSLYSMDASVHDAITQKPGSFEKTKSAVIRLQAANIPVQISCPIIKQNKDSFKEVIRWSESRNIAISINPVIFAAYDHKNVNLNNRLNIEEVEKVIDSQLSVEKIAFLKDKAKYKYSQEEESICDICRYSFCVSSKGIAFPCVGWKNMKIGDVRECSIRDIWEKSPKIKSLRNIKIRHFLKCVSCENKGYCTICMMINANENANGDMFVVNNFNCRVAEMLRRKIE